MRDRTGRRGLKTALVTAAAMLTALSGAGVRAQDEAVTPENHNPTLNADAPASNGPGLASPWSYAGKQGIGTAYEAYDKDGRFSDRAVTGPVSKVWFSLAQGVLTETMYGRIHEAQIREMQIAVTGHDASGGWTAFEDADTISRVAYIDTDAAGRPLAPAYRLTNTDKQGRFVIIKDVFTDPDRQSVMVRVTVKALKGPVTPYVILDPSMANTSGDDEGAASASALNAWQNNGGQDKVALSLKASAPFAAHTVGFTGVTDGVADLTQRQTLIAQHDSTGGVKGNIVLIGRLPTVTKTATYDLALGFGADVKAAA